MKRHLSSARLLLGTLSLGLVGLVQRNQPQWRLRPDNKLVVKGEWPDADDRTRAATDGLMSAALDDPADSVRTGRL